MRSHPNKPQQEEGIEMSKKTDFIVSYEVLFDNGYVLKGENKSVDASIEDIREFVEDYFADKTGFSGCNLRLGKYMIDLSKASYVKIDYE